jgi:hypothetical protein
VGGNVNREPGVYGRKGTVVAAIEQDRRAGPTIGSKTGFTAFLNVLPGHEQTLREMIEADQGKPEIDEAFREIGTLHEFRWVFFDNDRRLMFASAFDGSWEKYVQDFGSSVVGDIIDRNLQHVEGWVGIHDPRASECLLGYGIPAAQYASGYPDPSVQQIWKALALRSCARPSTAASG